MYSDQTFGPICLSVTLVQHTVRVLLMSYFFKYLYMYNYIIIIYYIIILSCCSPLGINKGFYRIILRVMFYIKIKNEIIKRLSR